MTELSQREREVLDHLLSLDFPGRDRLREQLDHAQVRSREPDWIEFTIDEAAPSADVNTVPAAEARVTGSDPPIEILLFVRDGRLRGIETVAYGEPPPLELPPPATLDPPVSPRTGLSGGESPG